MKPARPPLHLPPRRCVAVVWRCAATLTICATAPSSAPAATSNDGLASDVPGATDASVETQLQNQPQPFPLALGDFHVCDWRPTRNETPNLRFAVVIVFDADTPVATRAQLRHWVNRLRDQTIIAIRLAETKDFAEPSLEHVQRLIRVRVSRILPQLRVDRVLLTDFALGDD